MIVTIDGPAGSGKSTAARGLAERLGVRFLDTGAMYRAVAHSCLRAGIDLAETQAVAEHARDLQITFDGQRVFCNGEEVTEEIRTNEVTQASSKVAVNPGVREAMAILQRRAVDNRDTVTEGRDQGTVVFPQAEFKFFLTADDALRAARRKQDLEAKGAAVSQSDVLAELRERDERDQRRDIAPLRPADDAVVIDTSTMTIDETIAEMEQVIRSRSGGTP